MVLKHRSSSFRTNRSSNAEAFPTGKERRWFRTRPSWWLAFVPIVLFGNAAMLVCIRDESVEHSQIMFFVNVTMFLGIREDSAERSGSTPAFPKPGAIRTADHRHRSEYLAFPDGVDVPGLAALEANTTTSTVTIEALKGFHKRAGVASVWPHQIPHRTIFIHTHYDNPQDMGPLLFRNIKKTHRIFAEFWNESPDQRERHNHVAPMWFLGDDDCLLAVALAEPRLVPHYTNETRGNNKAHLCRIAALYLKGGYYFDVDLGTIQAVPLANDFTFATPVEYNETEPKGNREGVQGLFNSFLAAAPGHPILRRNLDLFLDHYQGAYLPLRSTDKHLGTETLTLAFDSTPDDQKTTVSIELAESLLVSSKEHDYPGLEKQEGSGCCCDFFVENPERNIAYFWSRIPGSGENCRLKDGQTIRKESSD